MTLAVLVERTFDIEQGVGASHSRGGMPKNKEIHKPDLHFRAGRLTDFEIGVSRAS
jgi:hypothetical protein